MRIPMTIDRDKAGYLWSSVVYRSKWLDVCDKVTPTKTGICGLKGIITKICQFVIEDENEAAKILGHPNYWPETEKAYKYIAKLGGYDGMD